MKRSTKAALMAAPFLLVGSGTRSNEGPFVLHAQQPGGSVPVVTRAIYPSGALQKCLAETIKKSPQAKQFCDQLPAAAVYNQAGARFQAGDHAGAAQIVRQAAEAGNAMAQVRLAIMIDQADGVKQDFTQSHYWYARAATQGEPESLYQVSGWYEIGDGVPENWDLSAALRKASAEQGWMKGQFAYGRAYQFGIGVPQNRQIAIQWYQRAAAQGHPDGAHWAQWLSSPTNNIGFRSDVEHDFVMGARLRFGASLLGGDPAGITFHNSGQRALWRMFTSDVLS